MSYFYKSLLPALLPALLLGTLVGSAGAQTVNDPADQTVCANSPTAPVVFTGTGTTYYTWVNNNPAIGLPASGTGNIASFVAQNATQAPLVASVTVTPFGVAAATFTNSTSIAIPGTGPSGPSAPYPTTIAVSGSGLTGTVTKVTARLIGLSHTFVADVNVLLVGPDGVKNTLLMASAGVGGGGSARVNSLTLTFDDAAATPIPNSSPLSSGTYRPADNSGVASLTAPAPAPTITSPPSLARFNGTNPNGTWALYVWDDGGSDVGDILEGWEINITTSGGAAVAGPSETFTYTVNPAPTVSLSNNGPLTCSNTPVLLTATPGGSSYVFSASATMQMGNTAQVTRAGLYSVTLTDANQCSNSATTTVTATDTPPMPTVFTNNTPTGRVSNYAKSSFRFSRFFDA